MPRGSSRVGKAREGKGEVRQDRGDGIQEQEQAHGGDRGRSGVAGRHDDGAS